MSKRDELLQKIAEEINELPWEELSLVISTADGVISQAGYAYYSNEVESIAVESFDFYDYVDELRDETKVENESPFKKMLVQLEASSGRVKCDFEYDDEIRWSITPKNMNEVKEEIRPRFD